MMSLKLVFLVLILISTILAKSCPENKCVKKKNCLKTLAGFSCEGRNTVCCEKKRKNLGKFSSSYKKCSETNCVLKHKCKIANSKRDCQNPNHVCCKEKLQKPSKSVPLNNNKQCALDKCVLKSECERQNHQRSCKNKRHICCKKKISKLENKQLAKCPSRCTSKSLCNDPMTGYTCANKRKVCCKSVSGRKISTCSESGGSCVKRCSKSSQISAACPKGLKCCRQAKSRRRDCSIKSQCLKRNGKCFSISRKDKCKAEFNEKWCRDSTCGCCLNGCSKRNRLPVCKQHKGNCFKKKQCKEGKQILVENGCNTDFCICCANCKILDACSNVGGTCTLNENCENGEEEVPFGCKGKKGSSCKCCKSTIKEINCPNNTDSKQLSSRMTGICPFNGTFYNVGEILPDSCMLLRCNSGGLWEDLGNTTFGCGECKVYNDPHFRTSDGTYYDWHNPCNFSLVQPLDLLNIIIPTLIIPTTTTFGPTTSGPTTSGPTTSGPTTSGPTTSGPTTSGPTTSGPTTSGPTTSGPTTSGPTTSGPSTSGPTTSGPTTSAPTTSGPTTSGPTTSGPTTSGPPRVRRQATPTIIASYDPDYALFGKFIPCSSSGPSCVSTFTYKDSNNEILQIDVNDLSTVKINGASQSVLSTPELVLPSILVWRTSSGCLNVVGSRKISFEVCRNQIRILSSPTLKQTVGGMCGYYSGDKTNDLLGRDGVIYHVQGGIFAKPPPEFAVSWESQLSLPCSSNNSFSLGRKKRQTTPTDCDIEADKIACTNKFLEGNPTVNQSSELFQSSVNSCMFDVCSIKKAGNSPEEWLNSLSDLLKSNVAFEEKIVSHPCS